MSSMRSTGLFSKTSTRRALITESLSQFFIHFIDNEGALAALAKGSSSVLSGEAIVGFTHELAAKFGIIGWYDRVDSASNPVDKLSRGEMAGPWGLVKINFPPILLQRIQDAEGCL